MSVKFFEQYQMPGDCRREPKPLTPWRIDPMPHNPNCDSDHCTVDAGPVRKLPMGSGANLIVCQDCYHAEMLYRRDRNRTLPPESRFDRPDWLSLEIYAPAR